ncbi:MAG: DUF202 domain-containing protein [Nitrospirae bacterium]|nr:DUF202 domain-containing protein [Nitrospirota bacterium]
MFRISQERLHSGREYNALDRNFLAWVRTSVSLLVFGLGVEKFGIFMESLMKFSPVKYTNAINCPNRGSFLEHEGIVIVIIGGVAGLLGFVQYMIRLKHMDDKIYTTTHVSCIMITFSVVLAGILFIINLGKMF